MSSPSTSAINRELVRAPTTLLTLPEELRRLVYDAVLTDKRHFEREELPRLVHQTRPPKSPKSTYTDVWSALQRQAYGLTQVSAPIRNEFLPLYRERVAVRIDFPDLPTYIAEVIQCDSNDPALVCGNISIDVRHSCRVNLQNVLLLHNRAPKLHLNFTHPGPTGRDDNMMSILLDAHRWPKFHAYISERTHFVELFVDLSDALIFCSGPEGDSDDGLDSDEEYCEPPLLSWPYPYDSFITAYVKGLLHVKEEFREPWMVGSQSSAKERRDGLARWEDELGLGGSIRDSCSFRPQA